MERFKIARAIALSWVNGYASEKSARLTAEHYGIKWQMVKDAKLRLKERKNARTK